MPNGTDRQTTAENLLNRLANALDKLVTLEIETVVTDVKVVPGETEGDWSIAPAEGTAASGAKTTIRLEQGDIKNVLSNGALDNDKLMSLHTQQVALSRQIVADNIKALMEVARSLAS